MANARLNATITIGGAINGTLGAALGAAKSKLAEVGAAVRQLEREQRLLGGSIQTLGRAGLPVDSLRARYAALTGEIERARAAQARLVSAQQGMAAGQARMAAAGMALGTIGAVASTGIFPIVQAAKFENAMLGIAKQVDGARDDSGKLTKVYYDMGDAIQRLGREIPMATTDIADMVTAGARMGIARDELIGFTKTAATMATAFDLPAAQLADDMGKIATIFAIPIPEIGKLADQINYLDDNAISKGGDIIEVMKRIGGTAKFVKMPEAEAAALGSTFLTLGSTAEIAGTAANAVMRELSIATMQPKRFQEGLEAIKMDAKKVQDDMAKDATGTILKVLDKINAIPEAQRLTVATQLFGKEYGDDIAKLAGSVKEYRRQLDLVKSDKAVGSMQREMAARLQTTTAQWEITKNVMNEVAVNIGTVLLPAVNKILSSFAGASGAVADFVKQNKGIVGTVAYTAGTLLGVVASFKAVGFAIGAVTFAWNALKLAMMTNPIGMALTALATGAILVYQNWDTLKAFFADLWARLPKSADEAVAAVKAAFAGLWDDIKAGATAAIDWVLAKFAALGNAWAAIKSSLGFGDGAAPAAGPASAQAVPPVPPMATGGSVAGQAITDNRKYNITVNAAPGQSAKDVAKEVDAQARSAGPRSSGSLYDHATGQ